MNILLVSDAYLPSLGGVERHVSTLSRYLLNKGFSVQILTDTPSLFGEESSGNDVKILRTLRFKHRSHSLQWPYTFVYNSWRVKKGIEYYGNEFDLVHHHGSHILYLDKLSLERPLALTRHGILASCLSFWGIDNWCGFSPSPNICSKCMINIRSSYKPFYLFMIIYSSYFYSHMKGSLLSADKVISVSDFVGRVLYNAYKINNLKTIYNFIDINDDIKYNLEKPEKNNEEIDVPSNKQILLYSGRLDFQKGVHVLLESFKKIMKQNNDVCLILTGGGELNNYVKLLAKKYKNIIYLGYLSREQQIRLLSRADVFVAPSVYPDACPTTILEAMALGKPVISTKIGGIPELILDGKTGFLIEPNSPDELTSKILFTFNKGPELYKNNCISRAKEFDITNVGLKIIKLYDEMTTKK